MRNAIFWLLHWVTFSRAVVFLGKETPSVALSVSSRRRSASRNESVSSRADTINSTADCDPLKNVFVISLPGADGKERRDRVNEDLSGGGIDNFTFWWSIDKEVIQLDRMRQAASRLHQMDPGSVELSSKMFALALGHRRLYEHIVSENISCATIFEDDVVLAPGFARRTAHTGRILPANFDWVKLDYCKPMPSVPPSDLESTPVLEAGAGGPCTDAYIISKNGAELLAKANNPIWMNSDGIMDPHHLNYTVYRRRVLDFHVVPSLAWQNSETRPWMRSGE